VLPHEAVAARVLRAGAMHRLDLQLQQARALMALKVRRCCCCFCSQYCHSACSQGATG
jgi:hypothetical protein